MLRSDYLISSPAHTLLVFQMMISRHLWWCGGQLVECSASLWPASSSPSACMYHRKGVNDGTRADPRFGKDGQIKKMV